MDQKLSNVITKIHILYKVFCTIFGKSLLIIACDVTVDTIVVKDVTSWYINKWHVIHFLGCSEIIAL